MGDRLLAVTGIAPWPMRGGFSLRAARLLECLSSEWAVTLVSGSAIAPDDVPLDRAAGHEVILAPIQTTWSSVPGKTGDFGPIQLAVSRAIESVGPRAALMFNGTEFLALQPGFPPAVGDRVDCGTLERFRYLRHGRYLRRFKAAGEMVREAAYERRCVRRLDATVVAGEDDRRALEAIGRTGTVHVVPNGVDRATGTAFDLEAAQPTIAFTGTLSYYANVDAIVWFTRSIWPLIRRTVPNARLLVAGRTPSRRVSALARADEIEVRADVADMRPLLAESWVAIAPMRCGTGVKNKILEAWALARPVVMTSLATNGLAPFPASEPTVRNNPAGFAESVSMLLSNHDLRRRLGAAAHQRVLAHHSWAASAEAMSDILRSATNRILPP
jgi:glycosyltransferase involved in cell wall biosynthesis